MGWLETCAVEERLRFVLAVAEGDASASRVCRAFGISRKTGGKWLERYRSEGLAGLADRSRAPIRRPQSMDDVVAQACLAVRRAHPTWGPLKVLAHLERVWPETAWPAASTIGSLFDREGLTVKRRVRRRGPPQSAPFGACDAPNDTWCMDFKGWFRTGDGRRCEPFTLCDAASRYLLRCQPLRRSDEAHVWPVLDAAFREFGLPRWLRSDNGPPFRSTGGLGLSRLSVKLIKAGVIPDPTQPGKPQQNGRLERLHLTLLQDAVSPPAASWGAQLKQLAEFRRVYNEERPHQALGQATPDDCYDRSPRDYHGVLRTPDYDADCQVRRVRRGGEIKWEAGYLYVSQALAGEPVGLRQGEDGGWMLSFGPVLLGRIKPGSGKLTPHRPKPRGLVDNPAGLPTTPPALQPQQAP